MKIGIVTFHTPINYGAVLQIYALQKYIKSKYPSAEVKVINFRTKVHETEYSVFVKFRKNIFKYLYLQTWVVLKYVKLINRKNKFKYFVEQNLDLTERFETEEEFMDKLPEMDIYISGSDQVFHPSAKYIDVYYLNFKKENAIKIAYAPSFGISKFTDEVELKIKNYLLDFDALSCREKDGAQFMSKVVNRNIQSVLDPTFLLSTEQWNEIIVEPNEANKYIFIYDLNGANDLINIAIKIKKETGFKIICQTQKAHASYDIDKLLFDVGPSEFLGFIKNAEYVITDSFHGIALSVLFKIKLFAYVAKPHASGRVRSLLDAVGLNDQIVEHGKSKDFCFNAKSDSISNYDSVLDKLIEKSEVYLLDSINKTNKK
jgi:hypothetical protein